MPPLLVRPNDVGGRAGWADLVRDGVLVPLWAEQAAPRDLADSPAVRAAALAGRVPERCTVGRLTAAWVHAGGPAPERVDLLVPLGARRLEPAPHWRVHEARIAPDEVVRIAGLPLTSVQRTGVDVARWLPRAEALPALDALRDRAGFDAGAALDLLRALGNRRGVVAARVTLAHAAAADASGGRAPR